MVEFSYCSKLFIIQIGIIFFITSTSSFKISLDDVYDINLSDERIVVVDPETETTTIFYDDELQPPSDDHDSVSIAIVESGTEQEETAGTTSSSVATGIENGAAEPYAAPAKAPTSKPPPAAASASSPKPSPAVSQSQSPSAKCACGIAGTNPNGIRGTANHPEIEPIVNLGIEKLEKDERAIPIRPLIIGGNPSHSGEEFPWMTVIAKRRLYGDNNWKIICGGSVINRKYILTAAHCISKQSPNSLELWLRAYNTSNIKSNPDIIRLKARKLIPHPQWDEKTVSNDIGLIELNTPILFSESMNPVCMPKGTSEEEGDFSGQNGTVVGFGFTRPHGAMAKILQKLIIPILSHEECTKTKYGSIVGNNPKFLCAGVDEGGKDACTNDSGGPLTVVQNGKHKLVGIVSWGHGCAQPGLPGVYTRVTSYTKWIESVINKDSSISKRKC